MILGRTGADCATVALAYAAGVSYEVAREAILDKCAVSTVEIEAAVDRLGIRRDLPFRLGKSFSLAWGLYGRRAILTYHIDEDCSHAVYWDGFRIHCAMRPKKGGRSVIDFYDHLNGRSIKRPITLETPMLTRIASILIGTWLSAIHELKRKGK